MAGGAVTKLGFIWGAAEVVGRAIWQAGESIGGEDVVGADGE